MSETKREIEMVINTCYGGYNLSDEAQRQVALRKDVRLRREGSSLFIEFGYETVNDYPRDDPDVIAVVRQMGKAADGPYAELKIVKVTVEISVSSYDGMEEVVVSGWAE